MFGTTEEIVEFIDKEEVEFVDFRFCDLFGVQQHFNVPADTFADAVNALAFDGSSLRGFKAIHESDMKLEADPSTAYLDPFREAKTLVVVCSIVDPTTGEAYSRDPRQVAAKAVQYLKDSGIADTCYVGAEAEFFVFDSIRFNTEPDETFYKIQSVEGPWQQGKEEEGGNLGNKLTIKGGYFPVSPADQFGDLRDRMSTLLREVGLEVERAHHEVAAAGQQEINYKYADLSTAADNLLKFKYVIKNTARSVGKTATFMPKPIFGDNGSGMHTNLSLWKDGTNLFYDPEGYADLSDTARWFIGGLLKHAPSLVVFTNPTVNSYRRLVPGFEAPVTLVYSERNRSAAVRIPLTGDNPKAKRVEFRVPDASANPYLAFAACLMAGIDGIKNKIEPHEPVEKDMFDLSKEELEGIKFVPASLARALDALVLDHDFLTAGGVFPEDLLETWAEIKYEQEVQEVRAFPHPLEYQLYYGV
ncbi:type I glutamate--ammonia ligase [Actinomycetaceae bacterium MB13-C1-2]|nr:type I glutamate--ammonia ligase [Actinomycetaceae bacterium MB13-C1-2]